MLCAVLRSRCLLYFSDIIYSSSSRTHLLTPSGKKLGEKIALKYLTTRHETPCSYYLLKALIIATRSSCLVKMKSFCLILHFILLLSRTGYSVCEITQVKGFKVAFMTPMSLNSKWVWETLNFFHFRKIVYNSLKSIETCYCLGDLWYLSCIQQ